MHGAVHVLVEITFFYLWVILIWTDDTYFLFELFFLISDSGAFDVPLFLIFFIDLLSWTEFQHANDPCLGYFWKKFLFFRLKEGAMEFYWCFRINKHGHLSFWIMIAWFLERLTSATDFSDSKYLSFFFSIVLSLV